MRLRLESKIVLNDELNVDYSKVAASKDHCLRKNNKNLSSSIVKRSTKVPKKVTALSVAL